MDHLEDNSTVGRLDVLLMRLLDTSVNQQKNPVVSEVYRRFIRPQVEEAATKHLGPKT